MEKWFQVSNLVARLVQPKLIILLLYGYCILLKIRQDIYWYIMGKVTLFRKKKGEEKKKKRGGTQRQWKVVCRFRLQLIVSVDNSEKERSEKVITWGRAKWWGWAEWWESVREAALKMRFWVKLVVDIIRVHNVSFYTTCPLDFFHIGTYLYIYPLDCPPSLCIQNSVSLHQEKHFASLGFLRFLESVWMNLSCVCCLQQWLLLRAELTIITQRSNNPHLFVS